MKLKKTDPNHAIVIAKLESIADSIDGGSLSRDYSGRSMYGETCYGVEGDNEAELLITIGRELGDLLDIVGFPKLDNMGMGIIAYWPGIEGDK